MTTKKINGIKKEEKEKKLKFQSEVNQMIRRQKIRINENEEDIRKMQTELNYLIEENNLRRSYTKGFITDIRSGAKGELFKDIKITEFE